MRCLDWLNGDSWLAAGGDQGFLKVLQLSLQPQQQPAGDSSTGSQTDLQQPATGTGGTAAVSSITAPAQLTMNQTLESHKGPPSYPALLYTSY